MALRTSKLGLQWDNYGGAAPFDYTDWANLEGDVSSSYAVLDNKMMFAESGSMKLVAFVNVTWQDGGYGAIESSTGSVVVKGATVALHSAGKLWTVTLRDGGIPVNQTFVEVQAYNATVFHMVSEFGYDPPDSNNVQFTITFVNDAGVQQTCVPFCMKVWQLTNTPVSSSIVAGGSVAG